MHSAGESTNGDVSKVCIELKGFNLAPQVGFEPTTLRLTAECSTIELLRSKARRIARATGFLNRITMPRAVARLIRRFARACENAPDPLDVWPSDGTQFDVSGSRVPPLPRTRARSPHEPPSPPYDPAPIHTMRGTRPWLFSS